MLTNIFRYCFIFNKQLHIFDTMNGLIKEKVKASGFKYNHLAKQLNIHPQYFSMVMRGERNLSHKKELLLRDILKNVTLSARNI